MIRTVIVDDEQPARDELRYLLSRHIDIHIIEEADSASRAVEVIAVTRPDLVFLDIQMPGKNGFEVIASLKGRMPLPLVVFATAFDEYAVEAFEKSAVDYILKPFSEKRLSLTLDRVRTRLDKGRKKQGPDINETLQNLLLQMETGRRLPRISVEKSGKIRLLDLDEVLYCGYESRTIVVHTVEGAFPLYGIATMDKLADHLQGTSFFRGHRSLLVNLNKIKEFSPWFHGKYHLIMDDPQNSELSISRSRVKEFKERLGL